MPHANNFEMPLDVEVNPGRMSKEMFRDMLPFVKDLHEMADHNAYAQVMIGSPQLANHYERARQIIESVAGYNRPQPALIAYTGGLSAGRLVQCGVSSPTRFAAVPNISEDGLTLNFSFYGDRRLEHELADVKLPDDGEAKASFLQFSAHHTWFRTLEVVTYPETGLQRRVLASNIIVGERAVNEFMDTQPAIAQNALDRVMHPVAVKA